MMADYTLASGEFRIDPPLTWSEFKTSPYRPENARTEPDVLFEVETIEIDSADGVMLLHRAVAVHPLAPGQPFAYHVGLFETLRKLLAEYGDRHQFIGFFECQDSDGGNYAGDRYRLIVRDGEVVRIEPLITWPNEENRS
jgi:hypothetical protein